MAFIVLGSCSSSDDEAQSDLPGSQTIDFPNGIFVEATIDGERRSIVEISSPNTFNVASFRSNVTVGNDCEPAYGGGLREVSSNGLGGGIFIVFYGAARAFGDTDACGNPNQSNFANYFPTGQIPVNETQQRLDLGLSGGVSFISSFNPNFLGTSSTSYSRTQTNFPQPNATFEILNVEEKTLEGGLDVLELEGIFDNIMLYDQDGSQTHSVEDGSFRIHLQNSDF